MKFRYYVPFGIIVWFFELYSFPALPCAYVETLNLWKHTSCTVIELSGWLAACLFGWVVTAVVLFVCVFVWSVYTSSLSALLCAHLEKLSQGIQQQIHPIPKYSKVPTAWTALVSLEEGVQVIRRNMALINFPHSSANFVHLFTGHNGQSQDEQYNDRSQQRQPSGVQPSLCLTRRRALVRNQATFFFFFENFPGWDQ